MAKENRGERMEGVKRVEKQYNNNNGCPNPSEEELSSSYFQSNLLLPNGVIWRKKNKFRGNQK